MKLYTEEQVRDMLLYAKALCGDYMTYEEVLNTQKLIVLPTEEEIEEGLFHHSDEYALGFKDAILFIKYKIQGASK